MHSLDAHMPCSDHWAPGGGNRSTHKGQPSTSKMNQTDSYVGWSQAVIITHIRKHMPPACILHRPCTHLIPPRITHTLMWSAMSLAMLKCFTCPPPHPFVYLQSFFCTHFPAVCENLLADISADTYTLAHLREGSKVLRVLVHVSPHLVVYWTCSGINCIAKKNNYILPKISTGLAFFWWKMAIPH